MLHGLFIASIIGTCVQIIKEVCEPTIPAGNWTNKEFIHKDRMDGISEKEFSKNLANGKYKLVENYPEPHRDKDGKIIIENSLLYNNDLKKYGAIQTMKWVKQGKYNLTTEELKKEEERIKKKYDYLYSLL